MADITGNTLADMNHRDALIEVSVATSEVDNPSGTRRAIAVNHKLKRRPFGYIPGKHLPSGAPGACYHILADEEKWNDTQILLRFSAAGKYYIEVI